MRTHWILLIALLIFALSGCESAPANNGVGPMEPLSPPNQKPLSTPSRGDAPGNAKTPYPPNLQYLITKAVGDLAQRLSISSSMINLVNITEVTWPDSSLGCLQPGLVSNQVLTEGFLIHLEADNSIFQYHTDSGEQIILCENLEFPIIPITPGEIDDGQPWMPN